MDQGDFLTLSHTEAANVGYCKPHKIPGMSAESCAARKNAKPPPASCIRCEGLLTNDVKPEEWGQDGIGQGMKKTEEEVEVANNAEERVCKKCERKEGDCKGQWSKKTGLCNKCYQKWLRKKPPLDEFLGKVAEEPIIEEKPEKGSTDTLFTGGLCCPNCQGLESECSGEFNLESGLCDPCYRRWLRRDKPPLSEFILDEGSVKSVKDLNSKLPEAGERKVRQDSERFAAAHMTDVGTLISVNEVHGEGLLLQGHRNDAERGIVIANFAIGPEAALALAGMLAEWRKTKP